MKVRELIEALSKFDPELDVVYNYHCPEDGAVTVEIDGTYLCDMYRVQKLSKVFGTSTSFHARKPYSYPGREKHEVTECTVVALDG